MSYCTSPGRCFLFIESVRSMLYDVSMKIGIDYVGVCTPFFCNDGRRLLLHKRSEQCRDERGHWDVGGGKLEHGLSLEENVLKEVKEEYGCKGEITERLPALDVFRELDGQKTHWIAVPFFVRVEPSEVRINEPHKIAELGWFPLDRLPAPLHSGFAHELEKFRDYFDKHLGLGYSHVT